MNRLLLPYNKSILKINIILSSIPTIISSVSIRITSDVAGLEDKDAQSPLYFLIYYYSIWILTGGFVLSALYFEITRKNEYYFYYNMGLSKIKLILFAYTLHIIFILPLLYILKYV